MKASFTLGQITLGMVVAAAIAAGAGYALANRNVPASSAVSTAINVKDDRQILYWYDPMVPTQHFDKPGKSPFMDMELVPKYADEGNGAQGIMIEPAIQQNLGIRIVKVQQGPIPGAIEATASIKLNDRLVTILQARTTGYVDKVYPLAPGDVLASGTPIAELIVPEWEGAQLEFLALMRSGERSLARAARERMRLLGMPDDLIERVERTRKAQPTLTIRAPSTGLLQTLNVRNGMAVSAGTVLAQLNGLDAVWLDAAVPETQARAMRPGLEAKVSFPAFPGHTVVGKVSYILPEVDAASRTARVRIELQNPDGQLRPGLFAKVEFAHTGAKSGLLIPSESVIRSGKRNVVIAVTDNGRFLPTEVQLNGEADGKTVVAKGLKEGQGVVASGQFLIDSEANLRGVFARLATDSSATTTTPAEPTAGASYHKATGTVKTVTPTDITISHGPVPSIGWPAMTMTFNVTDPGLTKNINTGEAVAFEFLQEGDNYVIQTIQASGASR